MDGRPRKKNVNRVLVLALAGIVAAIAVSAGAGADRSPITMTGMFPDNWGQSISNADATARNKWPGFERAWCRGVLMSGYRSRSSFVEGNTRYWDKTFCVAMRERNSTTGSSFVLDARKGGVQMYRVKPYRLPGSDLVPFVDPPAPSPPAPKPPSSGCDPNYRGACVPNVPYDLDCADINGPVYVVGRDPHGFDGDGDGVGCES